MKKLESKKVYTIFMCIAAILLFIRGIRGLIFSDGIDGSILGLYQLIISMFIVLNISQQKNRQNIYESYKKIIKNYEEMVQNYELIIDNYEEKEKIHRRLIETYEESIDTYREKLNEITEETIERE